MMMTQLYGVYLHGLYKHWWFFIYMVDFIKKLVCKSLVYIYFPSFLATHYISSFMVMYHNYLYNISTCKHFYKYNDVSIWMDLAYDSVVGSIKKPLI